MSLKEITLHPRDGSEPIKIHPSELHRLKHPAGASSWQCDAEGCTATTANPGKGGWAPVGAGKHSGHVCSRACARAWLERSLDAIEAQAVNDANDEAARQTSEEARVAGAAAAIAADKRSEAGGFKRDAEVVAEEERSK